MTTTAPLQSSGKEYRVRVFVDFWNFQLAIVPAYGQLKLDWSRLGPWLTAEAGVRIGLGVDDRVRFEGMHVYLSYNPRQPTDVKLRQWATNTLDRFPGVCVVAKERKPRRPPKCPACHSEIATCPLCSKDMAGTVEKGIDTAIVTDMIRLAWSDSWDIAVLVSGDRDFIPAVEFLDSKGLKVIQGCFGSSGRDLGNRCWATIDLSTRLTEITRP